MILEYLYSDVANLYGDSFNVELLKKSLNEKITVVTTQIGDQPYFVEHDVDMIYMGSMMERFQKHIIDELKPYKERIIELINKDVIFLCTGNSFEIFGDHIDATEGLKIFDFYCLSDFSHHHNSCFLGKLEDKEIVGFKSCFSYSYHNSNPLFTVVKGYGFKDDNCHEGVHFHNFFGTYLIGPILVLNPNFTHYLLKLKNCDTMLSFESELLEAYNDRLNEYRSYQDFKEFKH